MPSPAPERWAILAGIPKVATADEAAGISPVGTAVAVDCAAPPRASVLTVPRRVSSAPTLVSYPYVAAADPSGLILLCATQPHSTFSSVVSYHLCDAPTGKSFAVPRHLRPMGVHGVNAGLIRRGRDFMVAELRPTQDGSGRATLLCFTAGRREWKEKEVTYSPPLHRQFLGEGVVAHAGMLWWVDLSYGVLACNPFLDKPEMIYIPLPRVVDRLPVNSVNRGVYSILKVSGGRLRYVQIHGDLEKPVITMWALADPPCAGDWNLERSVPFTDVWTDPNYMNTKLPSSVPTLALLHPTDPDKVYCFLVSHIFAVDLRLKKLVGFSYFVMPDPPSYLERSSHLVHAWQYDHSRRPEFLARCFKQEKAPLDPEYKKYMKSYIKRLTAAQNRLTPATCVKPPLPAATATIPVACYRDKCLKRLRDQDNVVMEDQRAKRMKLEAMLRMSIK